MQYSWYIIQAQSGFESKVKNFINDKISSNDLADCVKEVLVPTESIVVLKKGKKVNVEKNFFPGYVLVNMVMNDKTWHFIRSIPKVNGFLGSKNKPQPLSESEVNRICKRVEEGASEPRQLLSFEIGESVKVIDGPFESFVGVVESVDNAKGVLKISVSIFGRSTPVDLEFTQVEKL